MTEKIILELKTGYLFIRQPIKDFCHSNLYGAFHFYLDNNDEFLIYDTHIIACYIKKGEDTLCFAEHGNIIFLQEGREYG